MGLFKDRKTSTHSSEGISAGEAAVAQKLPSGSGPGTTGIGSPVTPSQGENTRGDSVSLGQTASGDRLPAGRGPGTSGLGSTSNTGSINSATDRSAAPAGSVGATGATAGVASAGAASAAAAQDVTRDQSSVGGHSIGHGIKHASIPDVDSATHDQKHLQEVVHESVRTKEVEEVSRVLDKDVHAHHIQHHIQPIVDQNVKDEIHHEKVVPVTTIAENHDSTREDALKYASLNTAQNTQTLLPTERTIVDLGEVVNEKIHHHVHHVIQPVVELETVDQHRYHTTIPTKQVVHEAPIVHKSTEHEPISRADFIKMGGQLGSGIAHDEAGVLAQGTCSRTVDGVGEQLAKDLHLGGTSIQPGSTTSPTRAEAI